MRRTVVGAILLCAFVQPIRAGAVDTGKLVEKDGKYVFVESMDPSMRLLLDRSLKNGMITQEEYDRAIQDSETRSYLTQSSFKAWYDRGFNFSIMPSF